MLLERVNVGGMLRLDVSSGWLGLLDNEEDCSLERQISGRQMREKRRSTTWWNCRIGLAVIMVLAKALGARHVSLARGFITGEDRVTEYSCDR